MVELREAELLAHHMESYLRALRGRAASLTPDRTHRAHRGDRRARAGHRRAPGRATAAIHRSDRDAAGSAPGATDAGQRRCPSARPSRFRVAAAALRERWLAVFTPSPELSARGIGVDRVRALLREAGEIIEAVPRVSADGGHSVRVRRRRLVRPGGGRRVGGAGLTLTRGRRRRTRPRSAASREPAGGTTPALLAPSHYVRVDLARLDDLMRMIGDLVIGRARLADALSRVEARDAARSSGARVQENSLAHRAAAARSARRRDARAARAGGRNLPAHAVRRARPRARNRQAACELEIRGQDTEIDKFLIERMLDPVLHLVRNAVSHGD